MQEPKQDQFIYTTDDVLRMLDTLVGDRGSEWWGEFFADRAKPCPFFTERPDENLAEWFGDQQVYERRSLGGGLGYSAGRLRVIWDRAPFSVRVLRQMNKTDAQGPCFGEDFLCALLATKEGAT